MCGKSLGVGVCMMQDGTGFGVFIQTMRFYRFRSILLHVSSDFRRHSGNSSS